MHTSDKELRSISWIEAFPALRLMRAINLALAPNRLGIALLCVIVVYGAGRILDGVWSRMGGGVLVGESGRSEIDAYATRGGDFERWQSQLRDQERAAAARTLVAAGLCKSEDEAVATLRANASPLFHVMQKKESYPHEVASLLVSCAELHTMASATVAAHAKLDRVAAPATHLNHERIDREADIIRLALLGGDLRVFGNDADPSAALDRLTTTADSIAGEQWTDKIAKLRSALATRAALSQWQALQPHGPFIAFANFQSRAFASGVRSVFALRWGWTGGMSDEEPSLLGCAASSLRGWSWLVTQRPLFAAIFGLVAIAALSIAGGAICRSAAVEVTREETLPWTRALGFAISKASSLIVAPLVPAGLIIGIALLLFVAGVVSNISEVVGWGWSIPVLGWLLGALQLVLQLLTIVLFVVALAGGFALAVVLLGSLLGLHLIWPIIATESADFFEGFSRGYNYAFTRPWTFGFLALLISIAGCATFFLIRAVLVLTLKFAHATFGAGANLVGADGFHSLGRLDALWTMPAWSDLSMLPSSAAPGFWGILGAANSGFADSSLMWVIAVFVFLIVALAPAFILSVYFCAVTQMYFILRRAIDATDYDELHTDNEDVSPVAAQPVASAAPTPEKRGVGHSLPVIGGNH